MKSEYAALVDDRMQIFAPVNLRAMFGGYGVFLDGLMFALIADDELYLKVDKESQQTFQDQGLSAFQFVTKGKTMTMSYRQAPEDFLEDNEILRHWAGLALDAALRSKKR